MNDIDNKIRAALQRSPSDEETNLAEEVITVFRGRNRWMHAIVVLLSLVFLALCGWAGVRFYEAENVREQLLFGGLGLAMLLVISIMKVWFWLEMHTNRVLRELKRVELLVLSRSTTP